jgi:hypothetical protein
MKIIHPSKCQCETCFPLDGSTIALNEAHWPDIKAAVADPGLNHSGDEFELTTQAASGYIVARLRSEAHLPQELRQFWMWRSTDPTSTRRWSHG